MSKQSSTSTADGASPHTEPSSASPREFAQIQRRERPLPAHLANSTKYPWSLIQLDYCAGVIPIPGICQKYGVSPELLHRVVKNEAWVRRVLTSEDIYGPKFFGTHGHPPGSEPVTLDDIQKHARTQAVHVIETHKATIARQRQLYEILTSRFLLAMNGTPEILRDDDGNFLKDELGHPIFAPWTGNRETPADILNKMSSALVRLVGLERQAYGLDVMLDPTDGGPAADAAVTNELQALHDKLNSIAAGKAEPAPPPAEKEG